jgi:hypothetical protein
MVALYTISFLLRRRRGGVRIALGGRGRVSFGASDCS